MNPQERKNLEKFTKFFIYKSIQTIVQSRLGERLKTKSKELSTGSEWFNLAINDIQEVQDETKKALQGKPTIPLHPVCVEISLKTCDNEWMILETWCLEWDSNLTDQAVKVSYAVYNRLSILLKSLTCITRLVPAYRISRQQNADSYVMCYRVYVGEPQLVNLGDSFVTKKVGQVTSPLGTLSATLAYRTRIHFTPTNKKIPLSVKEDHYNCLHPQAPEGPPTRKITVPQQRTNAADNKGGSEEDEEEDDDPFHEILFSASPPSSDGSRNMRPTSTTDETPSTKSRPSSSPKASDNSDLSSRISLATEDIDDVDGADWESQNQFIFHQIDQTSTKDQNNLLPNTVRLGAFAPPVPAPSSAPTTTRTAKADVDGIPDPPYPDVDGIIADTPYPDVDGIIADTPYPALFHISMESQSNSNSKSLDLEEATKEDDLTLPSPPPSPPPLPSPSPPPSPPNRGPSPSNQEFVLLELRPPFADGDAECDVGAFYRDCQNAPQLACFEENAANLETTVKKIAQQLNYYDEAQPDLDKFVVSPSRTTRRHRNPKTRRVENLG